MRRAVPQRLAALLAAVALVRLAGPSGTAAPSAASIRLNAALLAGVTPTHGAPDAPTLLSISGDGLAPGSRVSLLDGGPFLLGSYIMPEGARAVEVHGDHACVAFYSHARKLGGIEILDLTDPTTPARVGAFETGDSGVGVVVAGSVAYVPFLNPYTFEGGLHIVDIAAPDDPRRLGTFYSLVDPQAVAVQGTRAYVADGVEGLKIIDVTDPASPRLLGVYDTAGTYAFPSSAVVSVALDGSRLYAADTLAGLLVFDIADDGRPTLLGTTRTSDSASGVALAGRLVVVADGVSGLQIVDASDPARPRVVGSQGLYGNSGYFFAVAVDGTRAVVADIINGVQVIDLRHPAQPASAGALEGPPVIAAGVPGGVTGVAVDAASSLAALADGAGGLVLVDVRNAASPSVLGSLLTGGTAYIAAGGAGLSIVDVRFPGAPALLGTLDTPGDAQAVAVADGRAYVADGSRGLQVVDVSDGRHPALLGTYDTPGSARGVFVADGYAYVADDFMGMEIFDISAAAPRLVGRYDTPGRAVGVAVGGGRAYVADLNRGLQILDVRDREAPVLVQNLSTPGAAQGVVLAGDRLYVADGFSGLLEIDVGDPDRPILAGAYDTPGIATAAATASGLVFVADGSHGLRIIRPNPAIPGPQAKPDSGLAVMLPAGFTPGPYDLQVTGPDGAIALLPDGFLVCRHLDLAARLVSVDSNDAPGRAAEGAPGLYRLVLSGDDDLFSPGAARRARLLLPALPARVEVRAATGPSIIELRIGPSPGEATVLVSGPDPAAAALQWETIRAAGGVDLPPLDETTYGDLRLSVLAGAGGPAGRAAGRAPREPGPPVRYRYVFEAGRLVGAGAWGPGAALLFDVSAGDPDGCGAETRVTFDEPRGGGTP